MREEKSGRTHLVPLLVIGAIASACGIALGLLINWFPPQASAEGKQIDTLWDVLIIVSVPIFVLVITVVLYSVWKFRMRPGEELMDGGARDHQNGRRGERTKIDHVGVEGGFGPVASEGPD